MLFITIPVMDNSMSTINNMTYIASSFGVEVSYSADKLNTITLPSVAIGIACTHPPLGFDKALGNTTCQAC